MIIGVDLGTYSVKVITQDSKKSTFLSKITQTISYNQEHLIKLNGKEYEIGVGEFTTDWDKAKRENTLQLLFTALYKNSSDNVNKVIVGLPASQYKTNKEKLRDYVMSNRIMNVNGKDIIIDDCLVCCEGLSVYNSLDSSTQLKIGNNQCVIIDIGGRTTDICIIRNKKIDKIFSIKEGMLNIYSKISDYISKEYTIELTLEEAENVINNGLLVRGKQIDLSFITMLLKDMLNSILKELQLRVGLDVGYIVLAGGGSKNFELAFKNRFNNIITLKDPKYANVEGYLKEGMYRWQTRVEESL